ncbi:HNH endonuclease [Neorhizobium huautlense]|uniref:HNH endonuclease n=1 Tax=Neorhizobium huautlense TaxID=67774 RepID=UPI000CF9E148|nr:endonuclease [Neorhizobium huautlense]
MVKLTTLKPRLSTLPPRLGAAKPVSRKDAEARRLKQRDAELHWRKWYGIQRWKDLRVEVWKRDDWICQKTGVLCIGAYPAGNSPVADHIKPHNGNPDLFWDMSNIQTVSKEYHDSQKQREEKARW